MNEELPKKSNRVKEFFAVGDVFRYISRLWTPQREANINTRIMHGINRIAIVIFLAALIYWIFKRLS